MNYEGNKTSNFFTEYLTVCLYTTKVITIQSFKFVPPIYSPSTAHKSKGKCKYDHSALNCSICALLQLLLGL